MNRPGFSARRFARSFGSIAQKIGCSGETLRDWVRQAERDEGRHVGPASDEKARIREPEREVREPRRANEPSGPR